MSLEFTVEQQKECTVVHLKGRFIGKEVEDFLKEIETQLTQTQVKQLVIDLAGLDYIGSQGVASLTWLSTKYPVALAAASSKIGETLRMLKLEQVFKVYTTVQEAVDQPTMNTSL